MANITVKPLGQVGPKWATRTQQAAPEYEANAPAAGQNWESRAAAASGNFGQAVRAANIEGRFSSGIRRAGAGGYSQGVRTKGVQRYGPGAQAGQAKYSERVGPYLQLLSGIDLPDRAPRGDPRNKARSNMVQDRLHEARLAASAAGR